MKRIYWRPRTVSRTALSLISIISLAGLIAVEALKTRTKQPFYEEKIAAAKLALEAMDVIKQKRLELGHPINPETDPSESGLIGEIMTPVTSVTGSLMSKQTSVNPNFAAAVVDMFKRAGCKQGDVIAVALSGSFPSLNICVLSAVESLKLRPIIIASATASQFGANHPDLLWIDMENTLHESGLISFRSIAASTGGYEDLGVGMSEQAKGLVLDAIKRNRLPMLESNTFQEAIDQRMKTYREHAGSLPIRAFINVGGGTISVGTSVGKKMYHAGLNINPPRKAMAIDSVMTRFARDGIPVIHLVKTEELAERYGLPIAPQTRPIVGDGRMFARRQHNRLLAASVLLVIFASLYGFARSDVGFRILKAGREEKQAGYPEPMI